MNSATVDDLDSLPDKSKKQILRKIDQFESELHRNLVGNLDMPRDYTSDLGSARVSRVGFGVPPKHAFPGFR